VQGRNKADDQTNRDGGTRAAIAFGLKPLRYQYWPFGVSSNRSLTETLPRLMM
jgi:hypothetical protein